jgi:hypothetical protein
MNIIVVSDLCLNCSRTASLLGPPFNNKLWPVHISVDNVLSDEKLYSLRFLIVDIILTTTIIYN